LALSQSYARATAVLVDEFDAGGIESSPNDLYGCGARLAYARF
jgi:hypothetical protein